MGGRGGWCWSQDFESRAEAGGGGCRWAASGSAGCSGGGRRPTWAQAPLPPRRADAHSSLLAGGCRGSPGLLEPSQELARARAGRQFASQQDRRQQLTKWSTISSSRRRSFSLSGPPASTSRRLCETSTCKQQEGRGDWSGDPGLRKQRPTRLCQFKSNPHQCTHLPDPPGLIEKGHSHGAQPQPTWHTGPSP